MARVSNPRVVFWDSTFSQWSVDGVDSSSSVLDNGEFKRFNVRGNALHLTTFGVAVNVSQNVRGSQFIFTVTIVKYTHMTVEFICYCLKEFALSITYFCFTSDVQLHDACVDRLRCHSSGCCSCYIPSICVIVSVCAHVCLYIVVMREQTLGCTFIRAAKV